MKTKIISVIGVLLFSVFTSIINAQSSSELANSLISTVSSEINIPKGIGMKKHVLEDRIQSKVLLDIEEKSSELVSDGIESIEFTKMAISAIKEDNKGLAIDHISSALGRIETIRLRNPEMVSIPIRRIVRTDDIDTDLSSVKLVKENIGQAFNENKFHLARKELEALISEVRVETTSIPISTFPDLLKGAILSIENNDTKVAISNLSTMLNTLVVDKQYISLPCMRAEVLLEESLTIQPGHTDQVANRKLLLSSARDQINIAFELGQIKKESYQIIESKIEEAKRTIGTSKFKDLVEDAVTTIAFTKNEYNESDNIEI
jgi:hypothetical protein